ncbi:MAG: ABC transporter ATP-binding protein [Rhodocyclales bacterium GT-UBC]|nr:MAG: ABC transporter ATP-binding protein [Rhodocyclales bacterium GT-UBC]
MSQPLFQLSGIERHFALGETTVPALRGVSLSIERGESVAIWGPSGSGKSTLLNLLGLIDAPNAGDLRFDGEDVLALDDDALTDCRNRKIGFVFQGFNLMPVLTALENVMLPLQIRGVATSVARQRASDWLAHVGLERFAAHRPDKLSGGQRQRVAIARALVVEPMLVIADEPTANLDSENSRAVIDLLQKMNQETGVTCVFSTHDPRLLDHVPRHVRLADGLIESDAHPETAS